MKKLTGFLGVLIFLAILIAANALLSQARLRKDLTHERLYTLSGGTQKLLGDLRHDVTLKFYYSKSVRGLPATLKQYADRILDLLREYEADSGGKIHIEVLDPQPDSDEEEWAQRYGVQPQNLGAMGIMDQLYLGVVAVSGAKDAVIPFFSPSQEPQLEYLITRMITEVTAASKPKIGVLSTLPVMGMGGMSFMQQQGGSEPWVFIEELKSQYEVVQLNPGDRAIADDISTVVVIHPKKSGEENRYALDQFLLRGGHLVIFEDPACVANSEIMPSQDMGGMMDNSSDLNELTAGWGVEMVKNKVVADLASATQVRFQDGRAQRNPTWLSLRPANMSSNEIVTSPLEFVLMPFAGGLVTRPVEGVTVTPLISASKDAGFLDSFTATLGSADNSRIESATNPVLLAVRLTGKFKTAFPNGLKADPEAPGPAPAHFSESAKEGAVIIVSDVDLLYDRFAVERFGRMMYQLSNDNISLGLNAVEQMSGNPALISLRSRGSYERPFSRVIAMESTAQKKWREEELKLQDKLQATQTRLNELERTKDKEQRFVLSPEQQKEIARFRTETFETKKQLKEVRKNLRSDIEALGVKLKAANIAAMPVAVAVFGIVFGLVRRRRAAG